MASQVPREFVIGNFKPPKREKLKANRQKSSKKREARPGNSELHLKALRLCPCIVTLQMPAREVHHLKSGTGERGMQQRSTDKWGLPLRRDYHDALERVGSRKEITLLADWGIAEPLDLAAALWAVRPTADKPAAMRDAVAAMTKIIFAHCAGTKSGFKNAKTA